MSFENYDPEFYEYPEAMFGGAEVFTIFDEEDTDTILRVLYVGGGFQTATYIDERKFELVFAYYKGFDHMFEYAERAGVDIKNVLMIGAGGCAYPKYLVSHFDDVSIDAVEIDPVVCDIARKHFYMDEALEKWGDRISLIARDGRAFLEESKKTYDAILGDSFSGQELVAALASVEAAEAISERLNPEGIYLANVTSHDEGEDISLVQDLATTLHEVFEHVEVIPCFDEIYAGEDNYLVCASHAPICFEDALPSDIVFDGNLIKE